MPNDRATRGSRADRVNAVPDASIHRLAASFPGLFEAMGVRSVIRLLHTNWKCQLISSNTAVTPGDAKFNRKYTITSHYPFPARLPEVPRDVSPLVPSQVNEVGASPECQRTHSQGGSTLVPVVGNT